MSRHRIVSIATAFVVAAALSPAAFAGGAAANDQYSVSAKLVKKAAPKQTAAVSGAKVSHASKPQTAVKSSGTLPFTGLDLAFVAALGGATVAGGVGLRRLGRKRTGA